MAEATISDVARRAGVSRGTVSNVLNRPQMVAEPTRARVERAMEELAFTPRMHARLLAGAPNRTIALVLHDIGNPFFSEAARGAEDVALERSYTTSLTATRANEARQGAALRMMLSQRVSGVLLSPTAVVGSGVAMLRKKGIPVVLLDRAGGPDECSVAVDNVKGGILVGTHLAEIGIDAFVFVGGPQRVLQHAHRLQGLKRAVPSGQPVQVVEVPEDTIAYGEQAAGAIVQAFPRRRVGVFCGNDLLAIGAMRGLVARRVRVPADVAVVGYDDIEVATSLAIPLSSVRQQPYELGRTAAELLLSEIEAGAEPHRHRHRRFTPSLVVRASSQPS